MWFERERGGGWKKGDGGGFGILRRVKGAPVVGFDINWWIGDGFVGGGGGGGLGGGFFLFWGKNDLVEIGGGGRCCGGGCGGVGGGGGGGAVSVLDFCLFREKRSSIDKG